MAQTILSKRRVTVQKVTFKNQYQMKVAGNLFTPKNLNREPRIRRSSSAIRWAR